MLQKLTIKELKTIIPHFHKLNIPLYLWGKPSTGKTSVIRQYAKEKADELGLIYSEDKFGPEYYTCKIITMSQYDAPDLRGMPQIIKDERGNILTKFWATDELPRDGQGIIFFDELNLADESVRASIYSYILDGRLSNLPKIDTFWRIAASNRENDLCNVNTVTLALTSRFAHFEIEPNNTEILKYFLEKNLDSRVVGFLQNFPDEMFPKVWDERLLDNKANPFPRQWESIAKLIIGVKEPDLIKKLAAGCVGVEVASKFSAFCKTSSKIDLREIISKPESLDHLIKSEDKTSLLYSVISGLASKWYSKDKSLTKEKVVAIILRLIKLELVDFAVSFTMMILEKRDKELLSVPKMNEVLKELGVYFSE